MQLKLGASVGVYKLYKPSYIRAFLDAADAGKAKRVSSKSDTDDYIEKKEFRILCNYTIIYAKFFDAFSALDGGKAGAEGDDRQVTAEEWKTGYDKIKLFGFAALKAAKDCDVVFGKIDTDGSGAVRFSAFCKFLEKGEEEAGTDTGKLLAMGDDEE